MSDTTNTNNNDYTKTDINGIPARYVLTKDPNDPTGAASIVVKVIDIDTSSSSSSSPNPRRPILNPLYDFSQTPLHLQDQTKLVTQYRLGDHTGPYRRINPEYYTSEELRWYNTGEIPARPMSICMTYAKKCYLCGDFQSHEDLMCFESAGEHPLGYKFCKDCEPYFRRDMHGRLKLSSIWELRLAYEEWREYMQSSTDPAPTTPTPTPIKPFIWLNRTRRDENGQRDMVSKRPYRYTKWHIINWVPRKFLMPHYDEIKKEVISSEEYGVIVEQIDTGEHGNILGDECMSITKIAPIYDILAINFDINIPNANTLKNLSTYDPNEDDPLNKYTYEAKVKMMHYGKPM